MKWMITEDKLGADQNDVIKEIGKSDGKPIWIQGHAGSGKSVLLLHTLNDYLARLPNANVCVVVFTNALVDLLKNGLEQIPSLGDKIIPVYTIYEFRKKAQAGSKFDAVFCDEVQDLPKSFLTILMGAATKLIVAGDASQSIYNKVPQFEEAPAKPDEIRNTLNPEEKSLKVIYRLTNSMLQVLKQVFPEMLSSKIPLSKVDTSIDIYKFELNEIKREVTFIWEKAEENNRLRPSEVSAILINKKDDILDFCNKVLELNGKEPWQINNDRWGNPNYYFLNSHLASSGVPLMYVGSGYGSLKEADSSNKIVVMTYHSAKGLDFDTVYLPFVGSNMQIYSKERELLLVALSRSKNELVISYCGELHATLSLFIGHIATKPTTTIKAETEELDF